MRPARAGPGRTALVGSPTLKKNAPRAGCESEPTASHSTTYEPCCRASIARVRLDGADDDRAVGDLAAVGAGDRDPVADRLRVLRQT